MEPSNPDDKAKVIPIEVGGREITVSRNDLIRHYIARQLADMVLYLVEHIHRTDKGQPVDLRRNPQWQQIYADASPDIRIMASAQVGKTLYAQLRVWAAAELGLETGLVLPTDPKRNEFVHNRIERTLEHTLYYRERIADAGGANSTREKHYRSRDGYICPIHFVASASDNELIAFSADQMIIDEKDRCDRDNLKLYPSRMNQSDFRLTMEASTPTLPGYEPTGKVGEYGPDNIHTEYLRGTRQCWHITCEGCGLEQSPQWEENVVRLEVDDSGRITGFTVRDASFIHGGAEDVKVCCKQCGNAVDRLAPGRWIAERPDAKIQSYWVNRLCSDVGEPLSAILDRFAKAINNPSAMQQVYNMDLGIPYAGGFVGFREELFRRCAGDYSMCTSYEEGGTTAGIDVNVPFYDVHISAWNPGNEECPQRKIFAGKIQGRDNLYSVLRAFKVMIAVLDQQPELNMAVEMQEDAPNECGCRIVRAMYSTHPIMEPIVISEAGENPQDPPKIIKLDRTATLDAVYQSMLNREVMYFKDYGTVLGGAVVREHCLPVRTVIQGDGGIDRFAWVGGGDHQLHAANLDRIAGVVGKMFLVQYGNVLGRMVDYTHVSVGAGPHSEGGRPEKVLEAMLKRSRRGRVFR